MNSVSTTRPIHPIEARRAFGGDRNAPAIPGRIIGSDGDRAIVALITGTWVTLEIEDPRYLAALQREDLTRYRGRELLVLVNPRYHLVGLAAGPTLAPPHLEVRYAVARLENASVVEIPGEGGQPGWLVFRCLVEPVLLAPQPAYRVN